MQRRAELVQRNTGHTEWVTPSYILESVRTLYGFDGIELDPASSSMANTIVRARRIYTAEDDGLDQSWDSETLWLNPPYTARDMRRFVEKLAHEHLVRQSIGQAVVLTNNATETKWAQTLARIADGICLLDRRVPFMRIGDDGKLSAPKNGSLQGQMVWYIGQDVPLDRFELSFSPLGACFWK